MLVGDPVKKVYLVIDTARVFISFCLLKLTRLESMAHCLGDLVLLLHDHLNKPLLESFLGCSIHSFWSLSVLSALGLGSLLLLGL